MMGKNVLPSSVLSGPKLNVAELCMYVCLQAHSFALVSVSLCNALFVDTLSSLATCCISSLKACCSHALSKNSIKAFWVWKSLLFARAHYFFASSLAWLTHHPPYVVYVVTVLSAAFLVVKFHVNQQSMWMKSSRIIHIFLPNKYSKL